MLAPSQCSLLLFTSLNNRARPCRLFRNPNRSLLSRSTAIRATEFLSPKSIPTKMCLTCIEASLLSKGLALFYSEPVPRLAFFYIVNSSRGGEFAAQSAVQSIYVRRREATSLRSSPYGSFTTLHSLLRIIVARVVVSKAGQFGSPLWFGLPVRAKVVQAVLILSCNG